MGRIFSSKFCWGVAENTFSPVHILPFDDRFECESEQPHVELNNSDIAEMIKKSGANSFLFVLSWKAIIKNEKGEVNEQAVQYYKQMILELKNKGLHITAALLSFEVPPFLLKANGFTKRNAVSLFEYYSKVCFERFGQLVDNWITLYEPNHYVYFRGFLQNGVKSRRKKLSEAILTAHNLLLAHGAAVRAFRSMELKGKIGIALSVIKFEPESAKPVDLIWARIINILMNKWFTEALSNGIYPFFTRLIMFLKGVKFHTRRRDMEVISSNLDFVSVSYYGKLRISHQSHINEISDFTNAAIVDKDGFLTACYNIHRQMHLPMYIIDNGLHTPPLDKSDAIKSDMSKINLINTNITSIESLLLNWVDIRGYYICSLFDNYRYLSSSGKHTGLYYIDNNEIIAKDSASAFSNIINKLTERKTDE
ncbi:MAG: family 1 glycosylhydrolase [Bacillota bacterium]|nr:family 1 glycosylhydrolase [Bacillota bacterium]